MIAIWPDAGEIARAVCAAARLEGVDPRAVVSGADGSRARVYAGLALAHRFPTVPREALGRKIGQASCLSCFRSNRRRKPMAWFALERLNAVCAAMGWPAMTFQDVEDAPLIHCGRERSEFVAQKGRAAPPSAPILTAPVAGSGAEKEPASIQDSTEIAVHPARADVSGCDVEKGADAGPRAEKAPAIVSTPGSPPRSASEDVLAEATRARRKLHPMARVIDRRPPPGDLTAAFFGDPTPEQRRRMAEAGR